MNPNVSPAAQQLARKMFREREFKTPQEGVYYVSLYSETEVAALIQSAVKELVSFIRHKRECIMDGASEGARQHLTCTCGLTEAVAPWEVPEVGHKNPLQTKSEGD